MKVKGIFWGALLMGLGILLGAFGAHGLKQSLSPLALETYQTGVHYHLIHALALLIIGVYEACKPQFDFRLTKLAFMCGIFLFSVNCYLYSITGIKTFAMIVPVGGVMFVLGWLKFAWQNRNL